METNHRKIIILRGIPGSGKSTFAKELVSQGFKRINKDDIRKMINNYSLDNSDEHMINEIQRSMVKMMMGFRRNIVIDNTHAKQKYVDELLHLIEMHQTWLVENNMHVDYEVEIKVFDVPLEECLRRNALRESPVFEAVIRKMHKQLFGS